MSGLANLRVRRRGALVLATVDGEIDVSNSAAIGAELRAAVPNDAHGLVIDLTAVEFLDSSGVHVLFDLHSRLERRQQRLTVVAPAGSPPRRVLDLSGEQPNRWVRETVTDALAE